MNEAVYPLSRRTKNSEAYGGLSVNTITRRVASRITPAPRISSRPSAPRFPTLR